MNSYKRREVLMSVNKVCRDYFQSIADIAKFSSNNWRNNFHSSLAVISIFTVIIPLVFAIGYAATLKGRGSKIDASNKQKTKAINDVAKNSASFKRDTNDKDDANTGQLSNSSMAPNSENKVKKNEQVQSDALRTFFDNIKPLTESELDELSPYERGLGYFFGLITDKDEPKGLRLLQKCADRDNDTNETLQAQVFLDLYNSGLKVKNRERGIFTESSEKRLSLIQELDKKEKMGAELNGNEGYDLAICYFTGEGVEIDCEKACKLIYDGLRNSNPVKNNKKCYPFIHLHSLLEENSIHWYGSSILGYEERRDGKKF